MTRILIGYDGTESAKRALDRALALRNDDDQLAVINVTPLLAPAPRGGGRAVPGDTPETHRAALAEAEQYLQQHGVSAEIIDAEGDPGIAICDAAERGSYDTIIVGSRNLPGVKRLLLGSVSDRVVRHAKCDVYIAR
jgi:nucleotide-binding universal stress UspA family protein